MMQGRYLLARKLVDTHGVSPFAVDMVHDEWLDDLQAFAWLRHFRDARNDAERSFARSLALDWIARDGRFDRESGASSLTARRVLNWLRHFNILVEGANPEDAAIIARSLGTQIQSLRLRAAFAEDPVDALMAAIALLGVSICDQDRDAEISQQLERVNVLLDQQIDEDGLHRSRSASIQLMLMVELDDPAAGAAPSVRHLSQRARRHCSTACTWRSTRSRWAPARQPISTAPARCRTTCSSRCRRKARHGPAPPARPAAMAG